MDGAPAGHVRDADENALWPAQPVQLARGRQPRDALAQTIHFEVHSLEEFETALRKYLDSPPDSEAIQHTDAQFQFWIGTSFLTSQNAPPAQAQAQASLQPPHPVQHQHQHQHQHQQQQQQQNAPPGYLPANGQQYGAYQPDYHQTAEANGHGAKKNEHKVPLSIMEALQPEADPKDKMRKQRAIAKCCVDAIQRTDGYRYSFHNCWNSREDDSFRFSYYCNDSLLNKDRAANGKGGKLGKRATKPVYDCRGVLSIKFSATKNSLDVIYKHVPVHKTYEERAPPPRRDSKRRKHLEETDPEALARIAARPKHAKDDSEATETRPKKKKAPVPREDPKPYSSNNNTSLESDLRAQSLRSLLELIQVDPSPPESTIEQPPPPPPPPPPPHPQHVGHPPMPVPVHSAPPVQVRRRPRNSCDVCKAKKTKCDGVRPVCQTCHDKTRQCYYSEPSQQIDEQHQQQPVAQIVPLVHLADNTLSELEKMKRELEEAKARIQELESEKRASTTPIQTPRAFPRSQPQPQPQPQPAQNRPQISQVQAQSHAQPQQQHQRQLSSQHRQQLNQLNQQRSRSNNSPQQVAYNKVGTPPQQQQRVINAQPSLQTASMQSATQQLQVAAQQLQTAPQLQNNQLQQPQPLPNTQRPQQLQNTQMQATQQVQQPNQQLQNPAYFANTHTNHSPYAAMTRTMTQGSISSQTSTNAMQAQNAMPTQVITPTTTTPVDANNPYARPEYAWPSAAYYGYGTAQQQQQQQQQQQDQWNTARGPGVFR